MKKGKRIFALLLSAVMISTLTITGCEKKAPCRKTDSESEFQRSLHRIEKHTEVAI